MHDVVIVGGGIAGLSAAWRLRHRDVLLLEAGDRLGGRLRSEPCGEHWLNLGAHLFPAPGSLVDGIATELGLETVPVTGGMMGLAVGDTVLTTGRPETYPARLPLTLRERLAFARVGLRLQRAVRARNRLARSPGTARDVRARVLGFGDDRTFADLLGDLPPRVAEILACAAHRATAEPDELSAGCGAGLFALVWGGSGSLIARNLLGGTGRLPEAMGAALGDTAVTGARVEALEADGDGHRVTFVKAGSTNVTHARHVIVAAQADVAAGLVATAAPAAADALRQIAYGAFLVVAVQTGETGPMPWDDTYAIATPGRVFDLFTNQAHALRGTGPRRPGGSLMLFAGGQAAAALSREPDDVIVAAFLRDLEGLFPAARGLARRTIVHRWAQGNAFARPGRARLQPALEGALGQAGTVHLAGDYFAELGNMEAAARTGADAAERVDLTLGVAAAPPEPSTPSGPPPAAGGPPSSPTTLELAR